MTASACGNRNQSGRAFVYCFAGMGLVGHIVQRDPAIGLHRVVYILARAH